MGLLNKLLITCILVVNVFVWVKAQDIYVSKNGKASFFSEAPLENINATSNKVISAINTKTGKIFFKIPVSSFTFDNGLMQEHFNEKYMESEKYPNTTFKGGVESEIDYNQNGVYQVKVTGKLTIHGVERERTIDGIIKVENGEITIQCEFIVKVADHKIKVPKLVIKNIAEVVLVKVNAVHVPHQGDSN